MRKRHSRSPAVTHTSPDAEPDKVVCCLAVVDIPCLAVTLQAAVPILKLELWLAFQITALYFGARLKCRRVEPGGCAVMQMPAADQCLTARWFAIMGMVWPCLRQ